MEDATSLLAVGEDVGWAVSSDFRANGCYVLLAVACIIVLEYLEAIESLPAFHWDEGSWFRSKVGSNLKIPMGMGARSCSTLSGVGTLMVSPLKALFRHLSCNAIFAELRHALAASWKTYAARNEPSDEPNLEERTGQFAL